MLLTQDLATVANFPRHLEDLRSVLQQVDELQKVRQQLSAEMADNSGVIGNLVVRAEDARLMNHMYVGLEGGGRVEKEGRRGGGGGLSPCQNLRPLVYGLPSLKSLPIGVPISHDT